MARKEDRYEDILTVEVGDISFFYAPRLRQHPGRGAEDVDRILMVLHTPGREVWRLVAFDGPQLLALQGERERAQGAVEMVTTDAAKMARALDEGGRGRKAQPVGTGQYAIARHNHNHTHLVYALELPKQPGEVLRDLRIPERSTMLLVVKNPEKGERLHRYPPPPQFHPWIQERFEGRRFMEVTPPEVLDFVGAEIALFATADDVTSQLGMIDVQVDDEQRRLDEMMRTMKLGCDGRSLEPLLEGAWAHA